jgi:hypothetical protein
MRDSTAVPYHTTLPFATLINQLFVHVAPCLSTTPAAAALRRINSRFPPLSQSVVGLRVVISCAKIMSLPALACPGLVSMLGEGCLYRAETCLTNA